MISGIMYLLFTEKWANDFEARAAERKKEILPDRDKYLTGRIDRDEKILHIISYLFRAEVSAEVAFITTIIMKKFVL